jgi:prepilin-type N-terminal cleavage/methylation domain-containing protein
MSRISDRKTAGAAGFTLVELLIATSILAFVLAGVLAAYLFVGRNLTRLINFQHQEVESRRTLRNFTQDLSAASQLTTTTTTSLVLSKPTASGTMTVTYTYNATNSTLKRDDATTSQTLASGLTSFTFNYYNEAGVAVTSSPQSVKAVELVYASGVGSSASGTLARYTTVSPRILLRNKQTLQ